MSALIQVNDLDVAAGHKPPGGG